MGVRKMNLKKALIGKNSSRWMRKTTRLTDCECCAGSDKLLWSRKMIVAPPESASFRDLANRRLRANSFNKVTHLVSTGGKSSQYAFAAIADVTNTTDNWSNRCYHGALNQGACRCGSGIGSGRFEIWGAKVKRIGSSGQGDRSALRGEASSGCWQSFEAAPRRSCFPSRELQMVRVRCTVISGLQCSMNTSIKGGLT